MRATWLRFPPIAPRLPPSKLEDRYREMLLENEGLVGRLTGDQYEPLLDRALKKLHTWALLTRPLPPARAQAAMEAAYQRVYRELKVDVRRAEGA